MCKARCVEITHLGGRTIALKKSAFEGRVAGVIVDVEVATGEENEGMAVAGRLDAIATTTGRPIAIATMDAGYASDDGRWLCLC
jgi:hypothetical protein